MLVPRFLHLDGVAFPLEATATGVRVAMAVPALEPVQLVLAQLCNPGATAEQRAAFAAGRDFVVPELAAVRLRADHPDARGGVENWRAFARAADALRPDSEIYLFSAGFSRHALALPRATAVALAAELMRLSDALRAGTLRAELAPPAPADPRVAGGPMEETLDDESPPDEEEEDKGGDAESAPHLEARAVPPAATEPRPRPELASAELLRELENAAALLDQLDPEDTLRSDLPSEELDALTAARRRTVLTSLDLAGFFTAEADTPALRDRLARDGLLTLLGYLDAAAALRRYLASAARARLVREPPPPSLLLAAVSLDYFRKPSPPGPPEVTADEWLALCEANFVRSRSASPRAGRTFVKLQGQGVWLWFRADAAPAVSLWRVVPAAKR